MSTCDRSLAVRISFGVSNLLAEFLGMLKDSAGVRSSPFMVSSASSISALSYPWQSFSISSFFSFSLDVTQANSSVYFVDSWESYWIAESLGGDLSLEGDSSLNGELLA